MQPEVIYFGFEINKEGIFPVPEKIDSIKNAKSPTNTSELKSYLGLLNYYHIHFRDFAEVLEPLYKLLRKGIKWEWGKNQEKTFQRAKPILTETDFLIQ